MIAIDVMGGDHAPDAVIKGALSAARARIPVMLCGPIQYLENELDKFALNWRDYSILLQDAQGVIGMGEDPVYAVRKKKDSSLVQAIASCQQGKVAGVVSAGNSGAVMVAATLLLGRKQKIDRPAIAGWLPTRKKAILALDLGANADCKPAYLYQFALLGHEHVKTLQGIENPRVALLCNGHEPGKGSMLVQEAFKLLQNSPLNFVGNVEPYNIVADKVDVLVCDGFSGNILLKTMEAMGTFLYDFFSDQLDEEVDVCVPLVERFNSEFLLSADRIKQKLAQKACFLEKGGALLLGVNGTVVVAHGDADEHAIERAICFAWQNAQREKE